VPENREHVISPGMFPARAGRSLLVSAQQPPLTEAEQPIYKLFWQLDATPGPMSSFLRRSLCYIEHEMATAEVTIASQTPTDQHHSQVTLTVADAFPASYAAANSSLVLLASQGGDLFFVYDAAGGPNADSTKGDAASDADLSWPISAITVAAGLSLVVVALVVTAIVACRKGRAAEYATLN
jgi:hypothetical protein